MDYVDFVIVNKFGAKALYIAPAFSYLKKGDKVMDNALALDVVASESFPADVTNSTTKMILDTFDLKSIESVPKLTAKVTITDFTYRKEVK